LSLSRAAPRVTGEPVPDRTAPDPGTLYGVSLGPGDPGLITRRAWALLERPDVHWTYPVTASGGASFALSIALAAGLRPPPDAEPLLFPMTHDRARLALAWQQAAERVLTVLRRGRDVLFLVEGDASTYSSFGYLAATVGALGPGVPIEPLAGVTSFSAAAARIPLSLGDGHDTIAILPAGYDPATVERLLDQFDTLVLLKVSPRLGEIIALLERRGRVADAVLVEKAGTAEERIVRDLGTLRRERVGYLSLVLIKRARPARGEPGCDDGNEGGPGRGPEP